MTVSPTARLDRELSKSFFSIDAAKYTKAAHAISFIQHRLPGARVVYTACPARTTAAQLCHMDRLAECWGKRQVGSNHKSYSTSQQNYADAVRAGTFKLPSQQLPFFEIDIPLVSVQSRPPPLPAAGSKDMLKW